MKKTLSILMVCLAVFSTFSMFATHSARSETSNKYRRMITVDNSGNPETLTNYQVFINVTYDSDMQPDFDDLELTWYNWTSGQEVNIDYWLDKYVNSKYALVWVEVPLIRGLGQEVLYMYYGDPDAVSESNGEDTFVFFDDFSTNTTSNYELFGFWHGREENKFSWDLNGWLLLNASIRMSTGMSSNVGVIHKTALINATEEKYCLETRAKAFGTGVNDNFGVRCQYKVGPSPDWQYSLQSHVRPQVNIQSKWGSGGPTDGWEFRNFGSIELDQTGKDKWYRFGVGTTSTGTVYGRFCDDDYKEIETLVSQTIHQDNEWWISLSGSRDGEEAETSKYTLCVYFDYVRVRKFTDPEPSYSIGNEELLFLRATVDINPNTLNLKSMGKWITAYIEFPEGYNVADINVSSILLNGTIPVCPCAPTAIGDYDSDGIPDLMVKFFRLRVVFFILCHIKITELLEEEGTTVTLTITGKLNDGTPFQGSDTIKIILPIPRHCKLRGFY